MSSPRPTLQVFLAHSHHDKTVVRDIFHLLRVDGFLPWLDELSLLPGQDWEYEIRLAVQQSDAVGVFLSRNSVDHEGYVHKEIALALEHALRKPEGSIFIIPIRLEECTIPARLMHLHWIELPETGFSISQAYLRLQRTLILRATQSGRLEHAVARKQPWFESMLYNKIIPDSYPSFPLDGTYLIRGENPNTSRYYGIASIVFKGNNIYTLTEEIGAHKVVYDGNLEGSNLAFVGKGYTVTYAVNRNDGILLGEWGEGGTEELIPASPFVKATGEQADESSQ